MVKKFIIIKSLNFSDKDCYYSEKGGNLDDGLYHGSKFHGKQYSTKEECEQFIPKLFEIENERSDGYTQVIFSIGEVFVKI